MKVSVHQRDPEVDYRSHAVELILPMVNQLSYENIGFHRVSGNPMKYLDKGKCPVMNPGGNCTQGKNCRSGTERLLAIPINADVHVWSENFNPFESRKGIDHRSLGILGIVLVGREGLYSCWCIRHLTVRDLRLPPTASICRCPSAALEPPRAISLPCRHRLPCVALASSS